MQVGFVGRGDYGFCLFPSCLRRGLSGGGNFTPPRPPDTPPH